MVAENWLSDKILYLADDSYSVAYKINLLKLRIPPNVGKLDSNPVSKWLKILEFYFYSFFMLVMLYMLGLFHGGGFFGSFAAQAHMRKQEVIFPGLKLVCPSWMFTIQEEDSERRRRSRLTCLENKKQKLTVVKRFALNLLENQQ